MKIHNHTLALCGLLALALGGCSPDLSRTYRGDVIDDKVTTERVQAQLTRAGSRFKNVQVETKDDVVVLTGRVGTDATRTEAENIARNVHRVTQLENDIQVQK